MPLLATVGSASVTSFGRSGIVTGGSAYYATAGAAKIQIAGGTPFSYGTGNFTIEMWIYPTSFQTTNVLWSQSTGRPSYFLWSLSSSGQGIFQFNTPKSTTGNTVTLNQWNHVALVRSGGVVKQYINGVGSGAVSVTNNMTNSITAGIGGYTHGETINGFAGYITNIRVAKSAIYTTDFIPSMTPFSRTSQGASSVTLLMNFLSSAAFLTDSSGTTTPTNPGTATYNALSPYKVPYVTPPNVVIVSATVSPSTVAPNEGDTITFSVTGTNTTNGTYYYTVEQAEGTGAVTAGDFTSASLSGSFTITGNAGSFNLTPTKDLFTEGAETFNIFVRSGSTSGSIIGVSPDIVIGDTSLTPTVTSAGSVNEGSIITFTASNVGPDGTYYWTVNNITTTNADFTATSGSFSISGHTGSIDNGTGTFNVGTVADFLTEGSETFTVSVRSGSISGPVIVTSSSVTINDTSLTQSATLTPTPTSGAEGSAITINVSTTNVANGSYTWNIVHGTTTASDFSVTSGTVTITSGTGSFTVTPRTDATVEIAETYQVEMLGSLGTRIGISSTITVNANST